MVECCQSSHFFERRVTHFRRRKCAVRLVATRLTQRCRRCPTCGVLLHSISSSKIGCWRSDIWHARTRESDVAAFALVGDEAIHMLGRGYPLGLQEENDNKSSGAGVRNKHDNSRVTCV